MSAPTPSLIFGVTGKPNDDTALFVLEDADFKLGVQKEHMEAAKVNKGCSAVIPPERGAPPFLNKAKGYKYDKKGYFKRVAASLDSSGGWNNEYGVYTSLRSITRRKAPPKLWINAVFGLAPAGRAFKVIMQDKKATPSNRVAVLVTGVPVSEGGRTWVLSPQGFPEKSAGVYVIAKSDVDHLSHYPELFVCVTNSVLFYTGGKVRGAGEDDPKFVPYVLSDDIYANNLDKLISDLEASRPFSRGEYENVFPSAFEMVKTSCQETMSGGGVVVEDSEEEEVVLGDLDIEEDFLTDEEEFFA